MNTGVTADLEEACDLIAQDTWGGKLSESQRRRAAEFAISRAADVAALLGVRQGVDLTQLSRQLGVDVEMTDESRQEAGSVVLSECIPAVGGRRPLIRVYLGSFCGSRARVGLALAHELFHYLETEHGRTGQMFIRQQQLGWRWRWRQLRVLSEVAAHCFARSVVGEPAHD